MVESHLPQRRFTLASVPEGYRDFLAGTVGGFSGKFLDYPLDTVKVLLQTQNSLSSSSSTTTPAAASATTTTSTSTPVYRGAIHCLRHTIETRGIRSLYIGIQAPLIGSMAENAVLFLSYGEVRRLMGERPGEDNLTLFQKACAGGVAGAIGAFVLNPFEVMKVQMQVMNSAAASSRATRQYTGTFDCFVQTVKNEGIVKGLYRGQTALLLREIPGNFCWYGTYETACRYQIPENGTKRDLGVSNHMLSGAIAGVAFWTAFYPADTVGSQIRANPGYASRNFLSVFCEIYKKEGWMGLYRGWGITAVRAAPAHALIFAMYEQTICLFRQSDADTVVSVAHIT